MKHCLSYCKYKTCWNSAKRGTLRLLFAVLPCGKPVLPYRFLRDAPRAPSCRSTCLSEQSYVRGILDRESLIAFENITRVEGQLTVDPQHLHRAVDGIYVHQPHRSWSGFHRPQEVLVGSYNPNHLPGLIEFSRQRLHLRSSDTEELLNGAAHFRGCWIVYHKCEVSAVGPVLLRALAELGQFRHRDSLQLVPRRG